VRLDDGGDGESVLAEVRGAKAEQHPKAIWGGLEGSRAGARDAGVVRVHDPRRCGAVA
jgi:hypothetical protein